MGIREIIESRRTEIGDGTNLTPQRASQILVELANLTGNILAEITKAQIDYNLNLLYCYKQEEKANRAKIMADTGITYKTLQEAKNCHKVVDELVKSLKYLLRAYQDEWKGLSN